MAEHGRHRAARGQKTLARHGKHSQPRKFPRHLPRLAATRAGIGTAGLVAASLLVVVRPTPSPADQYIDTSAMAAIEVVVPTAREVGQDYALVVKERAIAPKQVTVQDSAVAAGMAYIKTKGTPGTEKVTYRVVLRRGKEVSRSVVSRVAVRPAVDTVIVKGTGDPAKLANSLSSLAAGTRKPAGAKAWAKVFIMQKYGWGPDQYACLVKLWTRESNWRYQAKNKSSGAYGIPQALPGKRMAMFGKDWLNDPTIQMTWGAHYIERRYDTPCGAWAAFQRKGWY